jgi:hypothetical protein
MRLPNTRPITTPGPAGFLEWLQRESGDRGLMPGVIQHVRSNAPHVISAAALHAFSLAGLGQDDIATIDTSTFTAPDMSAVSAVTPAADPIAAGGSSGGWADTFAKVASPIIQGAEQIQLFNVQLARAQHGLPPLNTSQLRVPGVPLNVGLNLGSSGIWIVGGGLALLAYLFLGRRRA